MSNSFEYYLTLFSASATVAVAYQYLFYPKKRRVLKRVAKIMAVGAPSAVIFAHAVCGPKSGDTMPSVVNTLLYDTLLFGTLVGCPLTLHTTSILQRD